MKFPKIPFFRKNKTHFQFFNKHNTKRIEIKLIQNKPIFRCITLVSLISPNCNKPKLKKRLSPVLPFQKPPSLANFQNTRPQPSVKVDNCVTWRKHSPNNINLPKKTLPKDRENPPKNKRKGKRKQPRSINPARGPKGNAEKRRPARPEARDGVYVFAGTAFLTSYGPTMDRPKRAKFLDPMLRKSMIYLESDKAPPVKAAKRGRARTSASSSGAPSPGEPTTAKRRSASFDQTRFDKSLLMWFYKSSSLGLAVTYSMLQKRALELNAQLGGPPDFKATIAWVQKFNERHILFGLPQDDGANSRSPSNSDFYKNRIKIPLFCTGAL